MHSLRHDVLYLKSDVITGSKFSGLRKICVISVICGLFLEASELETRNSKLYSFPRGAVAQLAERRVRNAEARSSTLLCSTN